jgi:hypothetical protein
MTKTTIIEFDSMNRFRSFILVKNVVSVELNLVCKFVMDVFMRTGKFSMLTLNYCGLVVLSS